jgi:hypothetical protein
MTNPMIRLRNAPILAILFLSGIAAAQDANVVGAGTTDYWAESHKFRSNVMNERAKLSIRYESELLSMWGRLLDPSRLQSDNDFSESRELLKQGRSVVEKYESIFLVAFDNSANQVQQLNLTEAEKRQVVNAYQRGMAQSKLVHQEIWQLEHQKVDEIERIIDLLSDNRDSWTVDGNRILYGNQELQNQVNERIANTGALEQEQMRIRKAAIEAQREKAAEN